MTYHSFTEKKQCPRKEKHEVCLFNIKFLQLIKSSKHFVPHLLCLNVLRTVEICLFGEKIAFV